MIWEIKNTTAPAFSAKHFVASLVKAISGSTRRQQQICRLRRDIECLQSQLGMDASIPPEVNTKASLQALHDKLYDEYVNIRATAIYGTFIDIGAEAPERFIKRNKHAVAAFLLLLQAYAMKHLPEAMPISANRIWLPDEEDNKPLQLDILAKVLKRFSGCRYRFWISPTLPNANAGLNVGGIDVPGLGMTKFDKFFLPAGGIINARLMRAVALEGLKAATQNEIVSLTTVFTDMCGASAVGYMTCSPNLSCSDWLNLITVLDQIEEEHLFSEQLRPISYS
jgi:hypothetical protein